MGHQTNSTEYRIRNRCTYGVHITENHGRILRLRLRYRGLVRPSSTAFDRVSKIDCQYAGFRVTQSNRWAMTGFLALSYYTLSLYWPEPTALEVYFCRSLALALLTLAILVILLTGSVPLTSTFADSMSTSYSFVAFLANHGLPCSWVDQTQATQTGASASDPKAPYLVPTLTLTTAFHSTSAFYAYAQYTQTGQATFVFSIMGYGSLAAIGLWCLLFASSEGRIIRKTGADKRTSGFPFTNAEADKKKTGKGRKGL